MGILEREVWNSTSRGSLIDSLIIDKTNSKFFQHRENEDFLNHMNRLKDMKPAPQIKMTTGTTGHDKQWFEEKRSISKGIWALL